MANDDLYQDMYRWAAAGIRKCSESMRVRDSWADLSVGQRENAENQARTQDLVSSEGNHVFSILDDRRSGISTSDQPAAPLLRASFSLRAPRNWAPRTNAGVHRSWFGAPNF